MAKPLEPPRFTVELVKPSGFANDSWANWIRDLYKYIQDLEARIKELEDAP